MAEFRVLLVDDEPLVRQGIRDFLEDEPDLVIVGECGNGVEALETIARERVDLIFLDIQMPELDGVGLDGNGNTSGAGIGLPSTRARLAGLYGPRHLFALESREDGGVTVTVSIPWRRLEESGGG